MHPKWGQDFKKKTSYLGQRIVVYFWIFWQKLSSLLWSHFQPLVLTSLHRIWSYIFEQRFKTTLKIVIKTGWSLWFNNWKITLSCSRHKKYSFDCFNESTSLEYLSHKMMMCFKLKLKFLPFLDYAETRQFMSIKIRRT